MGGVARLSLIPSGLRLSSPFNRRLMLAGPMAVAAVAVAVAEPPANEHQVCSDQP